jgi:glycosyltransferase involved in cell wall biosynthesis
MKVFISATPLHTGHAIRGVGKYTRLLIESLSQLTDLEISTIPPKPEEPPVDLIHYPFFDLFWKTLNVPKKTPVVVTIHDVIPLVFPKQYLPGWKGKWALHQQKKTLKKVAAIITDSEISKQDIVKHLGVPAKKISVVYLAADPALSKPTPLEVLRVRRQYHLPSKYVLYVGDINYNKNIPQLIKMMKFLPSSVHLVCLGKNFRPQPIPEWQWIETQMAMSDVTNRVHFITTIEAHQQSELAAIYNGATAYIQPSLYEGFGLPVLEAMQCYTPVVAAATSSLIEVAGKHALFAAPTAEDLAQQVEKILEWSDSARKTHCRAAAKWAQTFSWSRVANETLQVYHNALANS